MILYISDLDGTLLASNDKLTIETVETVKNCIEKDINFTIATGRSLFYSQKYIEELGLKIPVVVSNGVYVYDPISKEYLVRNYINKNVTHSILALLEENNIRPFINVVEGDGSEKLYHKDLNQDCMKKVFDWQIKNNDNRQVLIDNYEFDEELEIVSINVLDKEERLRTIFNEIVKKFDVVSYLMEDHHYPGHFWLEVYSPNTSKGKAIEYLKRYLNASKVISFGDSNNDISMFEISDKSYAVSNASDYVKSKATEVIGCNNEHSVAEFLKNEC